MSVFDNQIKTNTILKEIQKNHIRWVSKEYPTIFVDDASNLSGLRDLNNDLLESLGIGKAGHGMQNLRMIPSELVENTTTTTKSLLPIEHCSQHLDTNCTDKCHRCKKSICSDCQHQLTLDPGIISYCEKCIDQVSCTIQ